MANKIKKAKTKKTSLFTKLYKTLDKCIITPISRFIYNINDKLKAKSSPIEKILNRPHILVYISLILAVGVFFLVDSQVINLVEKEAEIITNQPVKVLYNKEAYVIEGLVDSVDIILTGRKSSIYLAKQLGDHEVVLDLTDYKASDEPYKVKLTYNQTVDSISYKLDPTYVTVTIKNKVSDTFNVSADLLNEQNLNQKLSVKNVELEKSEVVVKGSRDTLDKIATVKALIDLSNPEFTEARTFDVNSIPLVAYDKDGSVIDNVEIVPGTITASITFDTFKKTVPLKVLTTGSLITGKSIASVTINGSNNYSIDIYGDKSAIDNIASVPVTIDISDLGSGSSQSYNLTISKPNGVRFMSETSAKIVVTFGDEKQKTVTLGSGSIKPMNVSDGLTVNLVSSPQIPVVAKGVQSALDTVSSDSISAYIDLAGYKAGEYEVEVKIDSDDPRIDFVVTNKVKIRIS